MRRWRFLAYRTEDGLNVIQKWYDSQEVAVRASFDAALFRLAAIEDWLDPKVVEYRELKREHTGMGEICFDIQVQPPHARKGHKRRFRVAGVLDSGKRQFVMLAGCEKTRIAYNPSDAFDTALKYKRQLEQGRGTLHDYF